VDHHDLRHDLRRRRSATALLPALAGESLYNGISWLSLLLTAFGAGSFTGALFVMNVGRIRSLGTIFVVAAMLTVYSVLVRAVGTTADGAGVRLRRGSRRHAHGRHGNNMLQATTDDAYRGRVMSVWP